MAQPARARETASKPNMVGSKQAADFWAAVEDCLVQFHRISRGSAAEKVTDLWRRLGNLTLPPAKENGGTGTQFDDMIYHAEPWYIACNLAEKEIPLDERNRGVYQQILRQNHLA
jgi:hypothetical protein